MWSVFLDILSLWDKERDNPAIPLLGVFLRQKEIYIHIKPYKQMFMAALFTIAPNCKQPRCP